MWTAVPLSVPHPFWPSGSPLPSPAISWQLLTLWCLSAIQVSYKSIKLEVCRSVSNEWLTRTILVDHVWVGGAGGGHVTDGQCSAVFSYQHHQLIRVERDVFSSLQTHGSRTQLLLQGRQHVFRALPMWIIAYLRHTELWMGNISDSNSPRLGFHWLGWPQSKQPLHQFDPYHTQQVICFFVVVSSKGHWKSLFVLVSGYVC